MKLSWSALGQRTNTDLLRGWFVLRMCGIQWVVRNSTSLLQYSNRFLGRSVTDAVIRRTIFAHFAAGENRIAASVKSQDLRARGIGCITDYAAEMEGDQDSIGEPLQHKLGAIDVARAAATSAPNFMAFKCSGLMDGQALTDVTESLLEVRRLWGMLVGIPPQKLETLGNVRHVLNAEGATTATLGHDNFAKAMTELGIQVDTDLLFSALDKTQDGTLDYLDFVDSLSPFCMLADSQIDQIVASSSLVKYTLQKFTSIESVPSQFSPIVGQFVNECVTKKHITQISEETHFELESLFSQLHTIFNAAAKSNVKLLLDAEETWMQPAIDCFSTLLQPMYNVNRALVYNTFQCYLLVTPYNLERALQRATRGRYHAGVKLVRGAYMVAERKRAEKHGYISPIQPTIADTHEQYDKCAASVLSFIAKHSFATCHTSLETPDGSHGAAPEQHAEDGTAKKKEKRQRVAGASVMFATHNDASVVKCMETMEILGIPPSSPNVVFAQIMGMADDITFSLAQHGYQPYKLAVYGPIGCVLPWLLRRAQENSSALGRAVLERKMFARALKNRLFGWVLRRPLQKKPGTAKKEPGGGQKKKKH
eukprot:TRINITY_DN57294_c0_g1_i1.p1 TRINITY_DN57294_c0_g1~~TRINITY_DN57294_c0_g1_i1.p1  ORF type:complete len:604 (-),score=32.74 TRINITY_DN57294_c0_g1_i1:1045-2826(-)